MKINISFLFFALLVFCSQAIATTTLETGFSPEGGAETLVIKVIDSAKKSLRVAAYSFTSPPITRALLAAKRRGVSVKMVVDYTSNFEDDRSGRARAALNTLKIAGITIRTISRYAHHHDKFIIADDQHVETGSFNYSKSAATRNSENVLVVWNNPKIAAEYIKHWESRFGAGRDYKQ